MKVPLHIVQSRREKLARLLAEEGYLPVRELCGRLGISEATARRDLAALQNENKITRTYGGALSEFNHRFPSFHDRCRHRWLEKERIAGTALRLLRAGDTCFFDSGTTVYAIAKRLAASSGSSLSVVTPNLPAAEVLAGTPGIEVHLTGGRMLARQSILAGEGACASLRTCNFDIGFFSAEGFLADGIYNSRTEIVELQRVVLDRTRIRIFCADANKIGREGPEFLCHWDAADALITPATNRAVERAGFKLKPGTLLNTENRRAIDAIRSQFDSDDSLPVHVL